jgi:hypothetical protein
MITKKEEKKLHRKFQISSIKFLLETSQMSYEERGKYITLICSMHQFGKLRKAHIIEILGEFPDKIMKKFIINSGGYYYHEIIENADRKSRSRSAAGIIGNKKRWSK